MHIRVPLVTMTPKISPLRFFSIQIPYLLSSPLCPGWFAETRPTHFHNNCLVLEVVVSLGPTGFWEMHGEAWQHMLCNIILIADIDPLTRCILLMVLCTPIYL
jgi:hypothetical protein